MKKLFTLLATFICAITMNAETFYLVGDATPGGWNNGAEALNKQLLTEVADDTYEWTGRLFVGNEGFKVLTEIGNWDTCYNSSVNGFVINGSEDVMSWKGAAAGDSKWKVSENGTYKVTIWKDGDDWKIKAEAVQEEGSGYAIEKVDGVYQIKDAATLEIFGQIVNEGEDNANAVLTADIDLAGVTHTAIGTDGRRYHGTFDGQGHRILNMVINNGTKEQGLFSVCSNATIKNLIIDASCSVTSTSNSNAAFVGVINGSGTITFENCGNEAAVNGSVNNAAFIGMNWSGGNLKVVLNNCYNTGNIGENSGNEDAVIIAWNQGASMTATNFYNTGVVNHKDVEGRTLARGTGSLTFVNAYNLTGNQGEAIEEDAVASGELCYKLNGDQSVIAFYQTLGTDSHPVFAGAQVYANGELKCDGSAVEGGEITYSNENNSVIPEHQYANGWCSVCGKINEDHIAPVDGVYTLNTMDDLNWFSGMVAAGRQNMNVVLNADIEQASDFIFTPVGTEANPYTGQFDGKFHAVTLDIENTDTYNNQGLFGTVSGDAKIANVIVKGYVGAKAYAAGIAGAVRNAGSVTFENCGNEATIEATGANAGGILGCNFSGKVIVKNCYNVGDIFGGRESAGISGWLGNNAVVENTYNAGTLEGVDGTKTFARWGSGTYTNCYNTLDANSFDGRTDSYPMDKVKSGELCVALGAPFTQNLGEDEFPTFGHKEVVLVDGVYTNPVVDAINNVNSATANTAKALENGQIVILRNGVKYNVSGVQIK